MHHDHGVGRTALPLALALCAAACGGPGEGSAEDEAIATTREAALALIGNIPQRGMQVRFWNITNPSNLPLANIVNVAACSATTLYAVEKRLAPLQPPAPQPPRFNYFAHYSKNGGQAWAQVKKFPSGSVVSLDGPELACDHAAVLNLTSDGSVKWTTTRIDGSFDGDLRPINQTIKVTRIQGGDGTIYGVKAITGGGQIYLASTRSIVQEPRWEGPIASIGGVAVTGTGTNKTNVDTRVLNSLAWPRRAYDLEANGTIFTNDTLLDGQNAWSTLNTGSERYFSLSVGDPNNLYALQRRGATIELNKITTEETSCSDNVDNDANGLKDTEDPACIKPRADLYCSSQPNGRYCASRHQPPTFLGQPNQQTSMIHCSNGVASFIERGVCELVAPGTDRIKNEAALVIPDPSGYGRWCNIHASSGGWGLKWGTTDPCTEMGGTIVRAGLYSLEGENQVVANCDDKVVAKRGIGAAPMQAAFNSVPHTANHCMFMVSPTAMPIFSRMFNPMLDRGVNPFLHFNGPGLISLAQFGGQDREQASKIDRFGEASAGFEAAYDHSLDEGNPLFAVAGGVVILSIDRDISVGATPANAGPGTTYQGEVVIRHNVGTSSVYREVFLAGYAHLRKRLVQGGQTVKAGQIIGYVGATGQTSGNGGSGYAHVHTGVLRASNVNAYKVTNYAYGYRVDPMLFQGTTSINPLGWAAPMGEDPWSYLEADAPTSLAGVIGRGALSIALFKPGEAFNEPPRP